MTPHSYRTQPSVGRGVLSTMPRPTVDYSLYYVTGRALLPSSSDPDYYLEHLELALKGGVTVVQIREKDVDGGEFYEVARRSKLVCDRVSPVSSASQLQWNADNERRYYSTMSRCLSTTDSISPSCSTATSTSGSPTCRTLSLARYSVQTVSSASASTRPPRCKRFSTSRKAQSTTSASALASEPRPRRT